MAPVLIIQRTDNPLKIEYFDTSGNLRFTIKPLTRGSRLFSVKSESLNIDGFPSFLSAERQALERLWIRHSIAVENFTGAVENIHGYLLVHKDRVENAKAREKFLIENYLLNWRTTVEEFTTAISFSKLKLIEDFSEANSVIEIHPGYFVVVAFSEHFSE